jgi:carbon-monoxide dehydrogenase small subunit
MSATVHVEVTVNGERRSADVEARLLLVHWLREELGLTGTRVGCDTTNCGACTVHVNGESVKSCTVLTAQADGAEVTTIEGLAGDDGLHPLQAAFIEHDAVQCGICIPGMLMSLKALLDAKASPDDEDIREAVGGNLCRCGTYPNTVKATHAAARVLRERGAAAR